MIRTSLIIPRIRERCAIFEGRVVGSGGYEQFRAEEQVSMSRNFKLPHAFVLPLHDHTEGEIQLSDLRQILPARFAVLVVVSNMSDEPGKAAADALMDARDQLHAALIGFQPSEDLSPILYAGMPDAPDFNRAMATAQFDFSSEKDAASAADLEA